MQNKILTHQQIQYTIRRIAYQIYEANVEEKEVIIAGINGGGLNFAKKIQHVLKQITPAKIALCTVYMDKTDPVKRMMVLTLKLYLLDCWAKLLPNQTK